MVTRFNPVSVDLFIATLFYSLKSLLVVIMRLYFSLSVLERFDVIINFSRRLLKQYTVAVSKIQLCACLALQTANIMIHFMTHKTRTKEHHLNRQVAL